MATKQVINPEQAPRTPLLSQAIVYGGMVYVSGNIGMDYATKQAIEGSVADRTKQALLNIQTVLHEAGSKLDNMVKVNIFLTDMADYAAMNKAYLEMVPDPKPCRTCVCVKELPFKTDVEIECIAHL